MALYDRDVILSVMKHMTWGNFMRARSVCVLWWRVSFDSQRHWFAWLCNHGLNRGWDLRDHSPFVVCKDPAHCVKRYHYDHVYKVARPLKTIPLHLQVFSTATRRRLKRFQKRAANMQATVKNLRRQYINSQIVLERVRQGLQRAYQDNEAIETQKTLRKRRKIILLESEKDVPFLRLEW